MEQLQREVQSLTDRLRAVGVQGSSQKKKPRRARKNKVPQTGSSSPGLMQVTAGSSSRRRRRGKVTGNAGEITLSRKEVCLTVKAVAGTDTGHGTLGIRPASFSFLKQFHMFDKVKWNRLSFVYKPMVGSTTNGAVAYGVQWGFDGTPPVDRSSMSALTPNQSHSVWSDGQSAPLVCPVSKLQTRPWFTPDDSKDDVETGPGRLCWLVTDSDKKGYAMGELWVDYSVTMTGTSF